SGVTDAIGRYNAGHSRGVCKGAEALFSAGQRDPAAAVEQGAFGGAQQSHGTGDIRTVGFSFLRWHRRRRGYLSQQSVLPDINPHRPWPATLGQGNGLFHDGGQGAWV